jgi:hypothetical protein
MVANNLILFLCLLFISAILGIQIATESTLALTIKRFLYLLQPYNQKLLTISKVSFWWRVADKFFFILLPLVLVFTLMLRLHHFLSDLLDCQYCTSTWVFAILLFFYFPDFRIVDCIIFAPLAILGVYIIERIKAWDK